MRFDPVAMRPSISLPSSLRADEIHYDEDDLFEIMISRERPANWDGDSFNVTNREYHHDLEPEGAYGRKRYRLRK